MHNQTIYPRTLAKSILEASEAFPVLLLTGPRQVGKTTLLEMCVNQKRNYVTLDDLNARRLALDDPGLFTETYRPPIIIDEVQYAPQLFSYIKMSVDREKKNGMFWLTGSQKFPLMRGIQESLAGRVAILDLLGLSRQEIKGSTSSLPFTPTREWIERSQENRGEKEDLFGVYNRIWLGSFPRVNSHPGIRELFYKSYVQTYIQRDIADILQVKDGTVFYKFLCAAAARTGQIINYADLARDVAIDNKTAKAWLSLLETSGLVYMLMPYHNNLTKRLVKAPKLYFLDTGLCSFLTKWPSGESLEAGAMSGAVLETYLFSEILKSYLHNGKTPYFYYYRDLDQKEIDLVIESGDTLFPIEFKKTATPALSSFKHFSLLGKFDKKIGQGGVLCFVKDPIPLSKEVTAIPINCL